MAVKATFVGLFVLLVAQSLMFCAPVVSATRSLAPGGDFTETIRESKLGKTTLAVSVNTPGKLFPKIDTTDPLKTLEDSLISLQKTIKAIFFPIWAIPPTLELTSIDNNLIDATNNVTREALLLSVKSLQQTIDFIFFPFLSIAKIPTALENSIESLAVSDLKTLENEVRSLESLFEFFFYPFLDITETSEKSPEFDQQLTFKSLEKSIKSLHSAFKFMFYPFLPDSIRTLDSITYSETEAELRLTEFSIRSVEEILKILFLPVRLIPRATMQSIDVSQDITFLSLELSIHSLRSTFDYVFSPFLSVPNSLQGLDDALTGDEALVIRSLELSIESVQKTLKYVFFPYLILPNAAESFVKALNETGLPDPLESVANAVNTLDTILLHVFFPDLPASRPPGSRDESTVDLLTWLVNVLRSLDDTLERLLVPYWSSAPPSSLVEYLWNDLVSLDNTLQYVLFPFSTDPIAPRARVSRIVGVTNTP